MMSMWFFIENDVPSHFNDANDAELLLQAIKVYDVYRRQYAHTYLILYAHHAN